MTEDELKAIEARATAKGEVGWPWVTAEQDIPALIAEVRRLKKALHESEYAHAIESGMTSPDKPV